MNIVELHSKFKDEHSPSPEAQVRWLQKQGFAQHQIDQAFMTIYGDLERGKPALVFEEWDGERILDTKYGPSDADPPSHRYKAREIRTGWELDQSLLEAAKMARTQELSALLSNIEKFEKKMRKKWAAQVPWYKRVFGVKPKEQTE